MEQELEPAGDHVPAAHAEQLVAPVAENVPEAHEVHEAAFVVLLNEPAAQLVQTRSAVALGVLLTYVPAAHVDHVVHAVAPEADQVPAAQAEQLLAPAPENVPAAQAVHEAWLLEPVNVPAAQLEHVRFTVALGVLLTYVPGRHVVQAVQLPAPAAE